MPKNNRTPVWASQNFLTSSATISRLINLSNLNKNDHAVEIGPGKGHITRKLLSRCGKVTAVEIDRELYRQLEEKFTGHGELDLVCRDFLKWGLPKTPYKVFANIPFNRTTEILRKLTSVPHTPDEAWLIVQKGAAKRFMGLPVESRDSLLIKPFFDMEIKYYFRKEDFHPAPSVDAVLLHLKKKPLPDIAPSEQNLYSRFISNCLRSPAGIYSLLSKKQISKALKLEKLSCDIITAEMLYVQWLCLFRCYAKFRKSNCT